MPGNPFPENYLDYLEEFRFDPGEVSAGLDENCRLHLEIEGTWQSAILWEVPVLALISELYYKMTGQVIDLNSSGIFEKDLNKCRKIALNQIFFSEFGTRRRYSFENQERMNRHFIKETGDVFLGTSNVYFAYKYNLKPIGTVAHEWFMVHGALYGYKLANRAALDNWFGVYKGLLGIALSDTYTSDYFIDNLDEENAARFYGVRQDSGDPFRFADKMILRYKELSIDPMTKTIVFSDNLNIDSAVELKRYCEGKIKSFFGIGTHFTNDVGVSPLNIVIKIAAVKIGDKWAETVKLTDDNKKFTDNRREVENCRKTLDIL